MDYDVIKSPVRDDDPATAELNFLRAPLLSRPTIAESTELVDARLSGETAEESNPFRISFIAPPVLVRDDDDSYSDKRRGRGRGQRGDAQRWGMLEMERLDDPANAERRVPETHYESTIDRTENQLRPGRAARSERDPRADRQDRVVATEPQRIKGSTRLEAKKQRRREGRDGQRRRAIITESEFLARREAVDRIMAVREKAGRIQIGVLEDKVLVEHYVAQAQEASLIGNVYLGKVQNVLPSMEAAFVDIGRGRNAVLYSGEVDWDAAAEAGVSKQSRRIELALKTGDSVLVQVTKDPVGHKGARLTSQISLPGRFVVYVPGGSMSGISRKLPDTERVRLKRILKDNVPENAGVIVRTAAEGASEEQLTLDVQRLMAQWEAIQAKLAGASAPAMLHSEPDLLVKIIRDVFNEDFHKLIISGETARATITEYLTSMAPDLVERVERYDGNKDIFDEYRVSEQIDKALDRKVWLPSGGSLVIDRTEAMTVVDVNTGKFVGSGGNLEETVTKNNLEAAEEIVRQLRLRDIGGIIVIDFIDMVLDSNRELVQRRLIECLSRDRTKHQVAEVTSLGLVQMTRKKLGLGLLESFSEPCEVCQGRGLTIFHDPVAKGRNNAAHQTPQDAPPTKPRHHRPPVTMHAITEDAKNAVAAIAARTISSELRPSMPGDADELRPRDENNSRPAADPSAFDQLSQALDALESPAPRLRRGGARRASRPAANPLS